jgi:hypothetical protein
VARQRVSDTLREQDRASAAALVQIVEAMRERYPNSLELKCAARDLADFTQQLAPETPPAAGEEPRG